MFKPLSVLLLLSTLVAPVFAQRKKPVPPPKRVYTITGTPVGRGSAPNGETPAPPPRALPQSGITFEKYSSDYDIRSDGTARQVFEVEQKCELEACLSVVKNFVREFNGDTHSMKLLQAAIIKAGGKRIEVPADAGKVLPTPQAESAPGFSSMRQLEFEFPGLAVGDTARYKVELLTIKPIFDKDFDSLERFPLMADWRSIEVNVSAPADYPLQFDAPGLQGGSVTAEPGRARWRWKAENLRSFPSESALLDPVGPSPRFAVTSVRSFEDLGALFAAGFREKAVVTPQVQKLADEITAGLNTPDEQAAAIYQWVNKNIRYLLVVLDRGGWVPHSTTEILQNGYGDCKDYTTLIQALLKAKKIESTPVLINADFGTWFPKVPVKSYFNHAILYVPALKLFADGTAPNTRLGIIPQQLVGKTAVLSAEKSSLIEVPKNNPDANQFSSDTEIEFAENGDIKAVSKNTVSGRAEMLMRPMFGERSRSIPADSLVKVLLAFYGINGTGRILSVSDPHKVGEPFTVEMEMDVPDYTTFLPKGSVPVPVGLNMNSFSSLEMFTHEEKRATDLMVGASRLRERYLLKLPARALVGDLPEPVRFSNAAGSVTVSYSRTESGVEIVRELVIAKDLYAPAEYPLFKELISRTVETLASSIAYTSDPKLLKAKTAALRSRPAATLPKSGMDAVMSALLPGLADEKLTPAQVRRLEAKVTASPADVESRSRLIRHYGRYDVKQTPAVLKARTAHRLWFVQNRPERSGDLLTGYLDRPETKDSAEYTTLRDEWLKQVAARASDRSVRLNAVEFVEDLEPDLAKKLLKDGMAIAPDVYEYPFQLARIARTELDNVNKKLTPEERELRNRDILGLGRAALLLVKKERSDQRDADRGELSINICRAALELGDIAAAESVARELVIEFGSEISSSAYAQASHIGNVTLGMAELSRGNTERAAEHLLTSIKAPLRKSGGYFTGIDFTLAKALFRKGEQKAVVEFLKQSLQLNSFKEEPEVYGDRIAAIKEWITQAEKGVEPSFDLDRPAVKK